MVCVCVCVSARVRARVPRVCVNSLQVLSLLLDAPGIEVNARDNSGVSALHHLAFQVRKSCVCMCACMY